MLGVGGEGQDTSQNFEGSFGPIRALLQYEASEQKLEQNLKSGLKEIVTIRVILTIRFVFEKRAY